MNDALIVVGVASLVSLFSFGTGVGLVETATKITSKPDEVS